jgi:hypothetical protein
VSRAKRRPTRLCAAYHRMKPRVLSRAGVRSRMIAVQSQRPGVCSWSKRVVIGPASFYRRPYRELSAKYGVSEILISGICLCKRRELVTDSLVPMQTKEETRLFLSSLISVLTPRVGQSRLT